MSSPTYFDWKDGCMIRVNPKKAYRVIKTIEDTQGACTAQALVNVSKDNDSLLHDEFEWNNKIAANHHRKDKARLIIRSLVVKYPESKDVITRAFEVVCIKNENRINFSCGNDKNINVYVNSYRALQDPEMRRQVVQRAARDLNSFRNRYQTLREVAKVVVVIDKFLKKSA